MLVIEPPCSLFARAFALAASCGVSLLSTGGWHDMIGPRVCCLFRHMSSVLAPRSKLRIWTSPGAAPHPVLPRRDGDIAIDCEGGEPLGELVLAWFLRSGRAARSGVSLSEDPAREPRARLLPPLPNCLGRLR